MRNTINDGRYILDGHEAVPCNDPMEWAEWMYAIGKGRQVKRWQGDGEMVSTVFLAFDHQWGSGPPLLFETQVFGGDFDGYVRKYSTWVGAERGHDETVAMLGEASAEKARADLPQG